MICHWISLSYATFLLVSRDDIIIEAAPIAKWSIGKNAREVCKYYKNKGAELVHWCMINEPR